MKLTGIEIHPDGGAAFAALSFRDPQNLGSYNVKGITGLDIDQITPQFYGTDVNGSNLYNSLMRPRDVVMKIGLNPNFELSETYSDLRDNLYRLVASSRTGLVQIQFKNGSVIVAVLYGYVSKLEAPQFERTQEVQITIHCDEPVLKSITPVNVTIPNVEGTVLNIPDLVSTAPHGFSFATILQNATASITINAEDDSWSFVVSPVGGFLPGDAFHFSSEYNQKELFYTRAFVDVHLLDVVDPGSVWPILFPGDNHLKTIGLFGTHYFITSYYETYWGV